MQQKELLINFLMNLPNLFYHFDIENASPHGPPGKDVEFSMKIISPYFEYFHILSMFFMRKYSQNERWAES